MAAIDSTGAAVSPNPVRPTGGQHDRSVWDNCGLSRPLKPMKFDLLLNALALPSAAAPHRTWAELHGGALSLAAAEAAARHAGPVCVLTASAADADRLEREM